jgi:hypothetical protein
LISSNNNTATEVVMNTTTVEKFQAATLSLACPGTIKDRLTDAYRNHLASVNEADLPADLREEFRAFSTALTRERPLGRGEDALRATVRKMSTDEAAAVAFIVVKMFGALSRGTPRGGRPKAAKSSASVVPLYLAKR